MVATVLIEEYNGTSGSEVATDKTSGTIRFKTADNATVDTNNPITIPASSSNWSYIKYIGVVVTVAPNTQISNIVAYTDGSSGLGTGVTLYGKAQASYSTPALESSSSGYTDMFTYTSGSPLTLGNSTYTGTGRKGNFLQMAMNVASTATQGVTSSETLTVSYDEI